jgi:hypothetical protein
MLLVGLIGSASAQEQSGGIQGVIKDSSGAVLPGVTVEVRNIGSSVTQTAVTDHQGIYRFPALPPGTYEVTGKLQGFTDAKTSNASIALGKILSVDLTMSVGGLKESVQVTGEAPLIDVKQNAAFSTVSRETIDRIPKGRDFTDVITMAPGANQEAKAGGIQVDGASGSENRFIIDGMDTTELRTGVSGKTMLVDFIQEVQVKSSGYNAEFGGATGGVVSAITKSGSNQFRGSLGAYEQSNALAGSLSKRPSHSYSPWINATSGIAEKQAGLISRATPWQYWSYVADLGGPIFKDRLWFYGGFARTTNDYNLDTWFVGEPGHPTRNFKWGSWATYPNYNLTTQITNNMRLRLSGSNQRNQSRKTGPGFNYDNRVYDGNYLTTSGCTKLALADMAGKSLQGSTGTSAPSWLVYNSATNSCSVNDTTFANTYEKVGSDTSSLVYSGNLDWVLTSKLFFNTTVGYYRTNGWGNPDWVGNQTRHIFGSSNFDSSMLSPQYPQLNGQPWPLVPAAYQQSSGYADVTLTSRMLVRDIMTRFYVNANGTWFADFAGQHVIKTGVRFERFGNDIYNARTKPEINIYWGRTYNTTAGQSVQGTYGYYMLNKTGTVGNVKSNNWSLWLQDSWSPTSNFTINAGVRAENEIVPSYKTAADAIDIKFKFGDKISPRVGFAWDVKGDGRWKAYGSYGWFYDITKLELPRGSFGGDHWINYYWTLDTYDWASINCDEGTTGCPGKFIEQWDARRSSNQVDPDLSAYFGVPNMTGIDPKLKPVRSGEWTLGGDHEINPTMSFGVRYTHKWLTRTIEDVGLLLPGIGEIYIIGNPGYSTTEIMNPAYPNFPTPKATRKYDAVEFTLRKRFAKRWSAEADYTLSRLWGNYGGLASSDEAGRTSPNVNRYFDNLYMSYDQNNKAVYGVLPTDRPHVLKVQATYDMTWGTSVGLFGIFQSGQPMSSTLTYAGYPIYYTGRNDLGRSPFYKQIDLNIQHTFKLGGQRRLMLQANVTNLFDFATYLGYYTYSPYRSGVTPADADKTFYGGTWTPAGLVAAARATGLSILDSDWYKVLDGQQGRRNVRFQAKFSF